ncbi:MAG: hypothetical protein FWD80_07500, partial [Propionibacteriaceae bacterium]|nr:hypothetical protein [Propionibacteriaceae bacterium]
PAPKVTVSKVAVAEDGPTDATRAVTARVRHEIEQAVTAGLSHLGEDAADRMTDLAMDARVANLPLLSRYLGTAAAMLDGLAERRDDVLENQAMTALARTWAFGWALDAADADSWPRLRGVARRDFSDSAPITLLPLGATWWVTASGARGVTLVAWDGEANDVRTATAARPAGVDAAFVRNRETTALWGAPLSTLLKGEFRVDGPRLSVDGELSATARGVVCLTPGFRDEVLREVAAKLAPEPAGVGFGDAGRPVALVATDGFGQMVIDESQQQLVWSVPVGKSVWQLRQEITPTTVHRVDTLLERDAARVKPAYILAQRNVVRGQAVWQPITLFTRYLSGLQMVALDFPDHAGTKLNSVLLKRWAMLRRRWGTLPVPPQPRSAVGRACDDVRDLIVDLAATGRLTPSPAQRRRLDELATRFDDLALATVAGLIRAVERQPGPQAVLRLQLAADRVADISAEYQS